MSVGSRLGWWGLLLAGCRASTERVQPDASPPASVATEAARPRESAAVDEADPEAAALCQKLAQGVEGLKSRFGELQNFHRAEAARVDHWSGCRISYQFRCRKPSGGVGWGGGVPVPEPDGVWFTLAVWEPGKEQAGQLQSQAFDPQPMWIGQRRVSLILRQGEKVGALGPALQALLRAQGAAERKGP